MPRRSGRPTSEERRQTMSGGVAPADTAAARAAVHHRRHADPVRADHLVQPAVLQPVPSVDPPFRRAAQLHPPLHGRDLPHRACQHRDSDAGSGAAFAAARSRHRAAARPQGLRPRRAAHADHQPISRHAGRGGPRLEVHPARHRVRDAQLCAQPVRRAPHRLDQQLFERDNHHGAHLAVDAVHGAHPAGRAAEPARRCAGGGKGRRRGGMADLPENDPAAPSPVHGARHRPRCHLPRSGIRRDIHDHVGRTRPADHECPLLPLRSGIPQLRYRARISDGGGGRGDYYRRRDIRLAHDLRTVQRRGDGGQAVSAPTLMRTPRAAGTGTRTARSRMRLGSLRSAALGLLTWVVVLLFFFPVLWMALTGFEQESDAATTPPHFIFRPTLTQYSSALSKAGPFLTHSVIITLVATLVVLALALPAAYALSVAPVRKWRDVLFFFISTKMLPVAGAIIPIYVIARELHLLDTLIVLIILYASLNLPIAVWMLRSFLLEVPMGILEAARVDGASFLRQLRSVIMPLITPGMAATALICFIFAWNEFFLAVNLTTSNAATVPVYLVSFQTGEGQFWAHLCAGATLACLPVLIAGWLAQDQLVRGLTMGAVK